MYCDRDDPQRLIFAHEFYERHRAALEAGAEVLWPEVEDLYALMCLRVDSGRTAFAREKQSTPVNPESCEWPEEYFADHIWFDEWPTVFQVRAMALDPSKGGQDKVGDYSAIVWVGIDRTGLIYVQADLARRPTSQMVADTVGRFRDFQPDALGIETNSFQELLAGEVIAEFRRQNLLARRRRENGQSGEQAGPHPPAWCRTSRRGGCGSWPIAPGRGCSSINAAIFRSVPTTTAPTRSKWRSAWPGSC